MPHDAQIRETARASVREQLANSTTFLSLPRNEQLALYGEMLGNEMQRLSAQQGMSAQLADPKKASDLIDDKRHENRRIEQAGELAGDFVDSVDFPGFVRDLLKGVFDANLEVTVKQMEAYTNLMKAATASISKFVNAIDDTAAFGYLAENNSDEFKIDFGDEKDETGSPKALLTDKDGNVVAKAGDLGDNEVKAKIMDAKIAMAREQRALLRETILMGVTRLVVERGTVKAACLFDIKAKEEIKKGDKAQMLKQSSSSSSVSASGGLFGKIFGGPSGGHTNSRREAQISVSSASSLASTEMAAKVSGSVELTFKSDYFKLDNFAQMYGPGAPQGTPANAGGPAAAPPQLPQPQR